mmetsp:Transcript_78405/g.243136  ORF Transcript_78405/g.243136 Transcript_78405/m.243136 type:complete len:207 (-) Transcript_78405:229-849(-)
MALGHRLGTPLPLLVRGPRVAGCHEPGDGAVECLDVPTRRLQLHSLGVCLHRLLEALGGLLELCGGVADLTPRLRPGRRERSCALRVCQGRACLAEICIAISTLRQEAGGCLTILGCVLQGIGVQHCSIPQVPANDRPVSQALPRHGAGGPVRFLSIVVLGERGSSEERPGEEPPPRTQERPEGGVPEHGHESGLELVPLHFVVLG